MRSLISNSSNTFFNLATEEYFLKNSSEEIFMLYINEPSVVVGKHQNLYSEINLPFARENKIRLARRISGGGAVYQDLNNINFSFIHNCENRDQINFTKFTLPILDALREYGLQAEFSGRNDLLIERKKISGNAMHIYKSRVLSHGTLLFNSNLGNLSASLKTNGRYTDKSIKSVKSEVTNISNYLLPSKTIEQFTLDLFEFILQNRINSQFIPLANFEEEAIYKLSKEKFETWEWIYGYSPKYIFKNILDIFGSPFNIEISVERGIINNTKLESNIIWTHFSNQFEEILTGTRHDFDTIAQKISQIPQINSDPSCNLTELCNQLF